MFLAERNTTFILNYSSPFRLVKTSRLEERNMMLPLPNVSSFYLHFQYIFSVSLFMVVWPPLKTCPLFLSVLVHYRDVTRSAIASQITGVTIIYSTVCSGADQRKHQSSASLAFVRGIHRWPVNSSHNGPVTRKMFPFDDVIMPITTWWYHEYLTKYILKV